MADIIDPASLMFGAPSALPGIPGNRGIGDVPLLNVVQPPIVATVPVPVQPASVAPVSNAPVPLQPVLPPDEQLKADLAQIRLANQNPEVMAALHLSEERGNQFTIANKVLDDYDTLTPKQFQTKYGWDTYEQLVGVGLGGHEIKRLAATNRDLGAILSDSGIEALGGFKKGLLAVGDTLARYGLGDSRFKEDVLAGIAGLSADVDESTQRFESQELGTLRYVDSLRMALDKQDEGLALQADQADDQNLIDSFATWGRDLLRQGLGTGKRLIEDPNMIGVVSAEGTGSMLVGGAVTKAARLPFALTIGAMEGGGAGIQAEQDVLAMTDAELSESPNYQALLLRGLSPEQAKIRLAAQAGSIASVPAALTGALTGKLVENIELAPFAKTNPAGLAINTGKEAVEESIQSGVGQVASNAGVMLTADADQSLTEGVGDAVVQGAVGGVGTTVLTQGPGVALSNAANAIGYTAKAAGTSLLNAITSRAERLAAGLESQSTVSEEKMAPAVQTAAENTPLVEEAIRTMAAENNAQGEDTEAFVQRVTGASQIQASDLEIMPASVGELISLQKTETGKQPTKFDALAAAAALANDETAEQAERVTAATYILKSIEANKQLFTEDLPAFMEKVSHESEAAQTFQQYAGILTQIAQTPAIKEALEWAANEMQMPEALPADLDAKTVTQMVATATVAPQAVPLTVADQILNQDGNGKVTLTPEQRRILEGTRSLAEAAQTYVQTIEAKPEDGIDFVNKQIEKDGGKKAHQFSLAQHVQGINQAIEAGDTKKAKARASSLGQFARHMRNKVQAFNTAIKAGDRKRVPYQSLGRESWLPEDQFFSVFFNPGTESSEKLARTVHAEATAAAIVANQYGKQFGLNEVKIPALEAMPAKRETAEEANEKRGSSEITEAPTPSQATTSRTESVSGKSELPPQAPAPVQAQEQKPEPTQETKQTERVEPISETKETEPEKTTEDVVSVETDVIPEGVAPQDTSADAGRDAEVVQLLEEFDDPTPISTLKTSEAFPTLVQPKGRNFFHRAFKFPRTQTSRMLGVFAPFEAFKDAFSTSRSLVNFLGGRQPKYTVGQQEFEAMLDLLALGKSPEKDAQGNTIPLDKRSPSVMTAVKARLRDVLMADKDANGKPKKPYLAMLAEGQEIMRWRDLRALNIMEKTDRGYRYNQELIETAVLAGLDWVMNASDRTVPVDRDDVAGFLGVDLEDVSETMVDEFNRGISLDTAKRTLADNIRKFWGIEVNKDVTPNFTQGIPEAVAAEILHGLEAAGLLELGINDKALAFPGLTEKTFNRIWFDSVRRNKDGSLTDVGALMEDLRPVSNLIADMALIEREPEGFQIGEPITQIDEAQLRNPLVKTTDMQKKALKNAQATPYLANDAVFGFFEAMGLENFVSLMSGRKFFNGDIHKTHDEVGLNKNHWKSVQGLQRQLASSFENVAKQMAQVRNHPEGQRQVYYKHHINRLGRIQMDGLSNPQSDKFAREIFMPTRAVIDLSGNQPDFEKFAMTIGQGIGIKTEKKTRSVVVQEVRDRTMTEGGDLFALVQALKSWNETRGAVPQETIDLLTTLQSDPKTKLSMHGIHSLITVAKYLSAKEQGEDLSRFETFTYLEADGKTNGPINSVMLYGNGEITPRWLRTVAKGGAFFGRLGKTLNAHQKEDSKDLYEVGADGTMRRVANLGDEIADSNPEAHKVFMAFQRLMGELSTDVKTDPKTGEITLILRGITKNPLTITIYGSGAMGIAGKITDELLAKLYEELSAAGDHAIQDSLVPQFYDDLVMLTSKVARKSDEDKWYTKGQLKALTGSAQDFSLDPAQYKNLKANIKTFLVDPMRSAIEEEVTTHVGQVTTATQQATQIQSIFLKAMFLDKVITRVAMKQANPDQFDYEKGDFLTQEEQDDILKSLMRFAPIMGTGTQSYFLAGGEKGDLFETQELVIGNQKIKVAFPADFSRSLTGDMSIPATMYGPTLAGVKAIPTLVVGSGDGQMQLNFLSAHPNETKRSLHVFDGINFPVDAIDDYSKLINEAVFKTWTSDKNPVRAALEAFETFIGQDPIGALFGDGTTEQTPQQKQAIFELSQIYFDTKKPDEVISVNEARLMLAKLQGRMSHLADSTDARRRTYADFPFSIDQMASAESPHVNQGTIKLDADVSYDALSVAMNARYEEHLAEIEGEQDALRKSREQDQVFIEALDGFGTVDELGARVIPASELSELYASLRDQLTPVQKEMIRRASKLLAGSGYQIVFGSPEQVDAWEQVNNADRYIPNETSSGKIDPISKIIIISNMRPETLTHELVHAATIDKVRAFYRDPATLAKEERAAVERLEKLMDEWLKIDPSREQRQEAWDARRLAEDAIISRRRKGQKAEALNEFMAWVLGNQYLAETAQKTKVQNPLARIVGDVLAALKKLLWGASNKGPRVGDSLLSNLRFNTRVLMEGPTQVELLQQDFGSTVMYQSKSFGQNERLTEIRRRLGNRIVSWVKGDNAPISNVQKRFRVDEIRNSRRAAEQVLARFAYRFQDLGTMQAQSTFTTIQLALMTEIELNPNALSRMEELYAHVIHEIGDRYSVFRENDDPDDVNDDYQARQKLDVLLGRFGIEMDKHGRSSLLSSFLALAMTSEQFRGVLRNIQKPKSEKSDATGIDGVLETQMNKMLDGLSQRMAGESKDNNVRDALDSLMYAMIENVGDQRTFIEQQVENRFDKVEDLMANAIQDKSAVVAEKAADIARTSNSRVVKAGATVVSFAATMINEQKAEEAALGMNAWLNRRDGLHTIKALVGDLMGRNRENAPIFDMISKVRAWVQQTRQQFREELPKKLNSVFTKPVSKAQWTAMFKALAKTDLAALASSIGIPTALDLIRNAGRLAGQIESLESVIASQDAAHAPAMLEKAKQLAHFMVTGEDGVMLLRNATAIGHLFGMPGFRKQVSDQLIADIDRLVTLYAIQETDQASKDAIIELLDDGEQDGLEFVTSYLLGQRIDELAKLDGNATARFNHYKGYVPSEAQNGGSLIIAEETEHAHLLSRGYQRVADYTGSSADTLLGARAYYFAPVSGRAVFNQGVLQTVHQTASGVDPESGFTVGETMAGRIEDPRVVNATRRQLSNQRQTTENLRPVFDSTGRLTAFERAADPLKTQVLDRSTNLADMIGAWRGRQAEELLAQEVNTELVGKLHEIWVKAQREGRTNEFINIAKLDPKKDDRVLIEAASLIPNQARREIRALFGPDTLMVRRDMLLDTFGARQASVGDLFTGGVTRWNPKVTSDFEKIATGIFGGRKIFKEMSAFEVFVRSEANIQELVTNVKSNIVVKSVVVPAANLISNMFQLLSRGVPVRSIIHGFQSQTALINTYIRSRAREIDLEADLRAAKAKRDSRAELRISTELQSIRDNYRRMSIWPLIEAGEFSAISDGQVTVEDLALAEGKWTGFIERKINELKEPLRTPARYALITRDTSLFKGLARAVQYGDFVAKAVLYEDLTRRKKVGQKDAIATVNEAFVNYNRLAGRSRQYLESVGLLWFYNYKLRIMKEAVYLLRHNPLRSLLMLAVPPVPLIGDIGSPLMDNVLSLLNNGKLGFSIGPGMGFHSWQLNPWINIVH